jgi:hypothetical protein
VLPDLCSGKTSGRGSMVPGSSFVLYCINTTHDDKIVRMLLLYVPDTLFVIKIRYGSYVCYYHETYSTVLSIAKVVDLNTEIL